MKINLYIRVDGYSEIGLGHLYRCMSLADMIEKFFNIIFVCKKIPNDVINLIKNSNYSIFSIEKEEEFLVLIQRKDFVLLDGYDFNLEYQKIIKSKECKLIIIDDVHENKFYADLIINQNPAISEKDYSIVSPVKFALGLDYVLLRRPFLNATNFVRNASAIKKVLICFGGADKLNLTESTLIETLKFSKFEQISVVTGSEYKNRDIIDNYSLKYDYVRHYHNITANQISDLMLNSDLGIIPSSGIVLEALACKMNIISGMYADNQKLLFKYLAENKFITSANNFSKADLNAALLEVVDKRIISNNVIDGKSPFRIFCIFLDLACNLRPANLNDIELLFNWANDKSVRKNSINKDNILWDNHIKWFSSKVQSKKTVIYILDIFTKSVGQIRYDFNGDYWEIDYSIDTDYQGMGLGKYILSKTLLKFENKTIKGNVLSTNISSIKAFQSVGFKYYDSFTCNNELYYSYFLNN